METGETFHLTKIDEVQKTIQQQRDERTALCTRYNRCIKAINFIGESLVVLFIGLGISVIGILCTTFAPATILSLEGAALGAGRLNIVGSHINKKLSMKAEKHLNIKTLAKSKSNTISDHVSKALKDNFISDEEYSCILNKLEKFNAMKEEIRIKFKSKIERENKMFRKKCMGIREKTTPI